METGRGAAAVTTWRFRGSRRGRDDDVEIPRRRNATPPRLRRGAYDAWSPAQVIIAWFYSFIVFNIADCAKLLFYAYFHTSSGVIEYHEEEDVEDEDHIEEEHKDMLAGKEGSQHLRPRVSAVPTAAGLQGFLIHGNTQDAGFAYTPGSDSAGE